MALKSCNLNFDKHGSIYSAIIGNDDGGRRDVESKINMQACINNLVYALLASKRNHTSDEKYNEGCLFK